jgi:hypothetical protein
MFFLAKDETSKEPASSEKEFEVEDFRIQNEGKLIIYDSPFRE